MKLKILSHVNKPAWCSIRAAGGGIWDMIHLPMGQKWTEFSIQHEKIMLFFICASHSHRIERYQLQTIRHLI